MGTPAQMTPADRAATVTLDGIITLADLIAYASRKDSPEQVLCDAILSLLAEDAPCGWEMPRVSHNGTRVFIPDSWATGVTPADARALARMLLRAADEAEKEKP